MAHLALEENPAREDARSAGLIYVSDERPGIRRKLRGDGRFGYVDALGKAVRDAATLARIRQAAIPPAWSDVWIAPSPNGHIQATGRDARGRKQYRYHPDFRAVRDGSKYEHIFAFAEALPKLRRRIRRDMAQRGLSRSKVLATIVYLLDTTLIRVGNDAYARENRSYGLTTLRDRHVAVRGDRLRFEFMGKSGKAWRLEVADRRVARIVKSCQELPGQHLFQYLDEEGERREVGSADVNAWLREVTGSDITAKDFRTWAGTVMAAQALATYEAFDSATTAKANVREAIETVAAHLGNTPTICRKCYVHPTVIETYLDGKLILTVKNAAGRNSGGSRLRADEAAVLTFLKRRLRRRGAAQSQRRTRDLKSR